MENTIQTQVFEKYMELTECKLNRLINLGKMRERLRANHLQFRSLKAANDQAEELLKLQGLL